MVLCLPGLHALPAPQAVQLVSLLPAEPIEDPDLWAWGRHPNGLGYKERVTPFLPLAKYQNKVEVDELLVTVVGEDWVTGVQAKDGLSVDQCIKNPAVADGPLCANAVQEVSRTTQYLIQN